MEKRKGRVKALRNNVFSCLDVVVAETLNDVILSACDTIVSLGNYSYYSVLKFYEFDKFSFAHFRPRRLSFHVAATLGTLASTHLCPMGL